MLRLERWETCTPEIARIIESLEINIGGNDGRSKSTSAQKQRSFQRNFATDNDMEIISFEENNFVNISNTSVFYDEEIKKIIETDPQQRRSAMFLKEQLIDRTKSVDAPIKKTTISYQELQMM